MLLMLLVFMLLLFPQEVRNEIAATLTALELRDLATNLVEK